MITFVNSNIFKVHDIKLRMSTKIFNNIKKKQKEKQIIIIRIITLNLLLKSKISKQLIFKFKNK